MVGLVAFNFVLRLVLARVMHVAFVIHVLRVHLDDSASDPPSLRIPAHAVARFEPFDHAYTFVAACLIGLEPDWRADSSCSRCPDDSQMPFLRWNSKAAGLLSVYEESEETRAAFRN